MPAPGSLLPAKYSVTTRCRRRARLPGQQTPWHHKVVGGSVFPSPHHRVISQYNLVVFRDAGDTFFWVRSDDFSVTVHNIHLPFNIDCVRGAITGWPMKEPNIHTGYLKSFTACQLCLYSLGPRHSLFIANSTEDL